MKVQEIKELFPESELLQLNPNAKYLIAIPSNKTMRECLFVQDYLKSRGVQAVVVSCSDLRIFELEKTVETPAASSKD